MSRGHGGPSQNPSHRVPNHEASQDHALEQVRGERHHRELNSIAPFRDDREVRVREAIVSAANERDTHVL